MVYMKLLGTYYPLVYLLKYMDSIFLRSTDCNAKQTMAHIRLSIIFSCLIGMAQYQCRCCRFSTLLTPYILSTISLFHYHAPLALSSLEFLNWQLMLKQLFGAHKGMNFLGGSADRPCVRFRFWFFFTTVRFSSFSLTLSYSHICWLFVLFLSVVRFVTLTLCSNRIRFIDILIEYFLFNCFAVQSHLKL